MEISNIKAVSGYVIRPVWDKDISKNGVWIDIGYGLNDQIPGRYWPTEGEVIASKPHWEAQKGDTIYFTWNALSFNTGCISHPKKDNLFVLKHSHFAYLNNGILYTSSENEKANSLANSIGEYSYVLLEAIEEKEEEKITDSGIVLSGFAVTGSILAPEVIERKTKKKLHGKIAVLPKQLPFDSVWNPHTEKEKQIEIGMKVVCENTSDVPVIINEKQYYRTRFSEIIYCYE